MDFLCEDVGRGVECLLDVPGRFGVDSEARRECEWRDDRISPGCSDTRTGLPSLSNASGKA